MQGSQQGQMASDPRAHVVLASPRAALQPEWQREVGDRRDICVAGLHLARRAEADPPQKTYKWSKISSPAAGSAALLSYACLDPPAPACAVA